MTLAEAPHLTSSFISSVKWSVLSLQVGYKNLYYLRRGLAWQMAKAHSSVIRSDGTYNDTSMTGGTDANAELGRLSLRTRELRMLSHWSPNIQRTNTQKTDLNISALLQSRN